jgi:biopolymer transport protein ExbD
LSILNTRVRPLSVPPAINVTPLELNSKRVDVNELLPLLADLMQQRPFDGRTLFIKAPAALGYGSVALLIDLAKGSGVITVGLIQDVT